MSATFKCGHPRTPENSERTGKHYLACKFCRRVYKIVRKVEREQERINAGLPIDGRIGAAAAWL